MLGCFSYCFNYSLPANKGVIDRKRERTFLVLYGLIYDILEYAFWIISRIEMSTVLEMNVVVFVLVGEYDIGLCVTVQVFFAMVASLIFAHLHSPL